MDNLYARIGQKNLLILVRTFYQKVFENEEISGLFQNPREEIEDKQFKFLTQFLGGPELYTSEFGPPKMRRRHMPHAITEQAKDEWLKCMFASIDELDIETKLKTELKRVFPLLAQHMVNR